MEIKKGLTPFSTGKVGHMVKRKDAEIIGSVKEDRQDTYPRGLSVYVGWTSTASPVCL